MLPLVIFGLAGFVLFPVLVKIAVDKLILANYGRSIWLVPAYAILAILSTVLGSVAGSAAASQLAQLLSLTGGFVSVAVALGAFLSFGLGCRSILLAYNKVV